MLDMAIETQEWATDMSGSVTARKRDRGRRSYLSGHAAEVAVARHYVVWGYELLESRWRGSCGEIDLILRDGNTYVFVEVKQAATFDRAACRVSQTQLHRIHGAASEYLNYTPDGQLSDVRLDLALCNGQGDVQILEAALSYF